MSRVIANFLAFIFQEAFPVIEDGSEQFDGLTVIGEFDTGGQLGIGG